MEQAENMYKFLRLLLLYEKEENFTIIFVEEILNAVGSERISDARGHIEQSTHRLSKDL